MQSAPCHAFVVDHADMALITELVDAAGRHPADASLWGCLERLRVHGLDEPYRRKVMHILDRLPGAVPALAIAAQQAPLRTDSGGVPCVEAVRALGRLGDALFIAKRFEEGMHACARALHLDPNDVFALESRARGQLLEGRLQDALVDATRAIKLAPNSAGALMTRGVALSALRRLPEALSTMMRLAALEPDNKVVRQVVLQAARAVALPTRA